jgi:hypothetical protein
MFLSADDPDAFDALIDFTRRRIKELGTEILRRHQRLDHAHAKLQHSYDLVDSPDRTVADIDRALTLYAQATAEIAAIRVAQAQLHHDQVALLKLLGKEPETST